VRRQQETRPPAKNVREIEARTADDQEDPLIRGSRNDAFDRLVADPDDRRPDRFERLQEAAAFGRSRELIARQELRDWNPAGDRLLRQVKPPREIEPLAFAQVAIALQGAQPLQEGILKAGDDRVPSGRQVALRCSIVTLLDPCLKGES